MRHWLSMLDWEPQELAGLIALARELKAGRAREAATVLRGRILGMVFFNPSLRTRASFEAVMLRFGGGCITLNVGGDTWNLEHREGAIMDGAAAEHIREAAPVLGRYCDVLGVRTFAGLKDAAEDAADGLIRAFGRFATVPVVSLESAFEHPCQGLADWMTVEEKLGGPRGRNFVLTWAPQVKPTPRAVPHSAALAAAAAGMNVTIAYPEGYDLDARILAQAAKWCAACEARLELTHDQMKACAQADALYVKSWASPQLYGQLEAQSESFRRLAGWMVDLRHLVHDHTILMHCLPVRRNVVISDAALDDPRCVVVDQAENRMWTQAAVLCKLLEQRGVCKQDDR